MVQPGSTGSKAKVVALEISLRGAYLAERTRLETDALVGNRGDIKVPCVKMVQCTRNTSINKIPTML